MNYLDGSALVAIHCMAFNHEPYIRECLDGFLMQQTNFKFVAIVHDDASTDKTADIIREYEAKYPEIIKPIYETENQYSKRDGTIARIMDEAIAATGAKYIAMCEGDDYWTDPLKLQKQVDFLEEHEDVGLCITDFCFQRDFGDISKPAFAELGQFKPYTFEEHLFNSGYIGPMTWMCRRDLYDSCKPENGVMDGTFVMALNFFALSKVAYLPDCTAVYRSHEGSATSQKDKDKAFAYSKNLFRSQVNYAVKYRCSDEIIEKLKLQGYMEHIHAAIEVEDNAFIQEAIECYRKNGMEFKWILGTCKSYVGYHHQYEQILHSKAYRLGKFLLKPFKVFKKK